MEGFELDITDFVTFGAENLVVVRVFDDGAPILYRRYPDGGGICGPVTVDFRENVYVSELLLDPDIHSGEVGLNVQLSNCGEALGIVKLQAQIEPFSSEFYQPGPGGASTTVELGVARCPPGKSRHRFTVKVNDPVLWDVVNPFLYVLRITSNARVLGQARFGFRKFEVRGKNFFLNDQPIHVLGTNPGDGWNRRPQIFCFNKANALRLGLKLYREANISFVRVHNGPRTQTFYDICDELGLIVQNDFSPAYAKLKKEEIKRAEMIEQAHVGAYVGPDGALSETFRGELRKWLVCLYNHASNCMFTAGNELGHHQGTDESKMVAYVDGFYKFLKKHDGQKRVITPSSGLAVWAWREPLEADYFDHHTYVDGDTGWADCVTGNMKRARDWERIYGKRHTSGDHACPDSQAAGPGSGATPDTRHAFSLDCRARASLRHSHRKAHSRNQNAAGIGRGERTPAGNPYPGATYEPYDR